MNIATVLIKKVILEADSETWANIRKHYLPAEYQSIYSIIHKYFESSSGLPSFDALKLSIRNNELLDKIYAIEAAEVVDLDNNQLLEFLKNEYTQEEIMDQISKFLDESIMMESAKESVNKLQEIIFTVEDKVDLKDPEEDMQKIDLFESDESLANAMALGLNEDYDKNIKFSPGDYILIGGMRGSGKSVACANIAVTQYELNRSSIYFTIEMDSRSILQRMCSISTGIPARFLRNKQLTSSTDWNKVAKWWSGRFIDGEETFNKYMKGKVSWEAFHTELSRRSLREDRQLDVVYDPSMTLGNLKSELDKKVHRLNPSVILVDYVNQVKRHSHSSGQYDWTEQIEISKTLKSLAQEYGVPIVSPYQMDASGGTRFSKGLLDSADAAYTLNTWEKSDNCVTFENVKMRNDIEENFTSVMNWETLKMGPASATTPSAKEEPKKEPKKSFARKETGEDLPWN